MTYNKDKWYIFRLRRMWVDNLYDRVGESHSHIDWLLTLEMRYEQV